MEQEMKPSTETQPIQKFAWGPLRFVTAASLFDGHDVSINIMRRMLQAQGAEVIHLGHNRSAAEIVQAAIQEDAHAVAISSYQGGHNEFFPYVRQLLDEQGGKHIKIFGGGGGVITYKEIQELHKKGVTKIYSPEDGMKLGLEGIIKDMLEKSARDVTDGVPWVDYQHSGFWKGKVISAIELYKKVPESVVEKCSKGRKIPVIGITGTGGAGKSSLIDELLLRFARHYPKMKLALISVDPSKKRHTGALLGDRIRLGSALMPNFFIRSMATRDSQNELSPEIKSVINYLQSTDTDLILVESSGIGQAHSAITEVCDHSLYVMTPEYGAASQLEKIDMLEVATAIVLNKFEKPRSEDALRDIRKQWKRNHKDFNAEDLSLPIFACMASQFNDLGVNALFAFVVEKVGLPLESIKDVPGQKVPVVKSRIIPPSRVLYLRDIADTVRNYNERSRVMSEKIRDFEALERVEKIISTAELKNEREKLRQEIGEEIFSEIKESKEIYKKYNEGTFEYNVRGKVFSVPTKFRSLSHLEIPKVALPRLSSDADYYLFMKRGNLPGFFPYASGVFPFKRADEDPKRMFAGEGGPNRTNKRFHFLSQNDSAKRLSTAFDSVTLYGEDPAHRPDIFGKIGESGVSIATLTDMQDLFKGFDLTDAKTSVSMTINGPAPIILAMYLNTAISQKGLDKQSIDDQAVLEVLRQVRGTVQADILKEDQAQNTCIFSLEFALKMMGDVQEFFCKKAIRNYYTISISGYHIAEAGANPITQVAFTLSNGFTYVEYFLSRGLSINDFSQNLSFFFSNGLDPEYAVIGRVARKIWAVTLRDKYGADEKAQKFKYHIQTSGRSLHAQEISYNDIRTTLQAYLALSDNCNSLHTNAYDEAITTPTEESVRRAMAIQMIINREFGVNSTDNPMQGSYLIEELCDLVEEAVLKEFEAISDKGGVMGAMESMYQRSKIQDESHHYETLKDSGALPIIGVNTFISDNIDEQLRQDLELTRASYKEKEEQINRLEMFQKKHGQESEKYLARLKDVTLSGGNIFEELMITVRHCSLGQITQVLYELGGRYRRNM
jgi:isobutyryl-CoA mutase